MNAMIFVTRSMNLPYSCAFVGCSVFVGVRTSENDEKDISRPRGSVSFTIDAIVQFDYRFAIQNLIPNALS